MPLLSRYERLFARATVVADDNVSLWNALQLQFTPSKQRDLEFLLMTNSGRPHSTAIRNFCIEPFTTIHIHDTKTRQVFRYVIELIH